MAGGTPITALTPRTTSGAPINVANAAPLMDSLLDPTGYLLSAGSPEAPATILSILTAPLYGVDNSTKIRAVVAFIILLPLDKTAKVTVVVDGNEQFTNDITGTGDPIRGTIEILPDSLPQNNVNFGGKLSVIFTYDNGDYAVQQVRYLLFAAN